MGQSRLRRVVRGISDPGRACITGTTAHTGAIPCSGLGTWFSVVLSTVFHHGDIFTAAGLMPCPRQAQPPLFAPLPEATLPSTWDPKDALGFRAKALAKTKGKER